MKKHLLIAAVATVLCMPALAPNAFAAPAESGAASRFSEEDRAAFTDARIAGLKAGLKLTAAQEKNWPALEAAMRERAKERAARMAEWAEKRKELEGHRNVIEFMQRRAKAMQDRAAGLVKFADAAKPLYDSLDKGQKRRFGAMLRAFAEHHGRHFGGGEGRGWGGGKGGMEHKG